LKGNRELLHIMQEDPIVRKKVEALTGYNYDINQQKFTSKISDQDYKKRFGTERQFFGKFDPTLTAEYRNKKFNL